MRWTWVCGSSVVSLCAIWALRPPAQVNPPPASHHTTEGAVSPVRQTTNRIEHSVFAAASLWNVPPKPPADPVAISEPPKPLKLQLIGIVSEGGMKKAALYDPDMDKLLIVSNGERVREFSITSITDVAVELTDGQSSRRLMLRLEPS
jgi:hypothetical protein